MRAFPLTRRARVADLMAHPLGSDVVDKLILFNGLSPLVRRLIAPLSLSALDRLIRPLTGPGMIDMIIDLVNSEPDVPGGPSSVPGVAGVGDDVAPARVDADPWWKSAVIYQVYPRSFADSDGDGLGDIRGLIDHLDYLQELGVDCLWLSPIFDSPNKDMGYDIRDYRAVMPEMGTLADVDELIAQAHARGMRVVLDLVVNHTSVENPWYRAAVADRDAPERGYFMWRDGDPSTLPNNWRSFFSGPAWTWDDEAGQWMLHLFDSSQAELNWDNPELRREVAQIVRWWLDRGIDGFRLDVINYISKVPGLPDGHPFVGTLLEFTGIEHYFYGPRLHEYLAELRREGFTRPDGTTAVMIGETPGIGIETGRLLSGRARRELDLIFNFDVLTTPGLSRWHDTKYSLRYLLDHWIHYQERIDASDWVTLFLENHDGPRIVSKVVGPVAALRPEVRVRVARLLATIMLTMRGTPFIFQGQELGAVNQPFASLADMRDIESVNRYSELLARGVSAEEAWEQILTGSRDHARVPMRWTEHQDDSGAWLPGLERTPGFSVAAQREDPRSVLAWYRELIGVRRRFSALSTGDFRVVYRRGDVVAWERYDAESAWRIEVNIGPRAVRRPVLAPAGEVVMRTTAGGDPAKLAAYEAVLSRVR